MSSWNPKKQSRSAPKDRSIVKWMDLGSPLPAEITDPEVIQKWFSNFPFVPYATYSHATGHALLHLIDDLSELSVTQSACRNSICSHVLGGKVKLINASNETFFEEAAQEAAVEASVRESLILALTQQVSYGKHKNLRGFYKAAFENMHRNGNCWVEVVQYYVAGVPYVDLHVHPMSNVLYYATSKGEDKYCAVSKTWFWEDIQKKKYDTLPVYPLWAEQNGIRRTMLHFKHGDLDWYGRPLSLPSLIYQYREWQDSTYLSKQANANFVGQVFMELEQGDPETANFIDDEAAQEAGFQSTRDRLEQTYTMKGENPSAMLVTERPYNSGRAFIYQFKPHTNQDFYTKIGKLAEDKIIVANQWSRRLSGLDVSAGLNTSAYIDELKIKGAGVLQDWKEEIDGIVNKVAHIAVEHIQPGAMEGVRLSASSPYEQLIQQEQSNQ